jgi:fused signal recognition particle receptor
MINWFKRKDNETTTEVSVQIEDTISPVPQKNSIFSRFRQGLSKTREALGSRLSNLLLGKKEIDSELLSELEALLITADLGIDTTTSVIQNLTTSLARNELKEGNAVFRALRESLETILKPCEKPLQIDANHEGPYVILMVGINGAGKTTTIGKLAKQLQLDGKKVMLAAGDTFRAAAVEQLMAWGERNQIPVVAQHTGADSASVIYDAYQSAKAKNMDVLIADTAGRLHTQNNLMEELKKVKRVIQKIDVKAPHEVMLVLDASIGQNALVQAEEFNEAVALTGITMTKLDGTARGGVLFAIAHRLGIPFRYIGIGEGIDDLRPFEATYFLDAIFDNDNIQTSQ